MRRISLSFLFAGVLVAACAETTDTRSPKSSTDNDSGATVDAAKRDGSTSVDDSSVVDDAANAKDTSIKDSTIGDSAKDVTTSDTGVTTDSGRSDAALDAMTDAADAADAADASCVPPSGNFARCGVATATSEYTGFGAEKANDGDINSGWYAATGACPSNACPGTTISVTVSLDVARTIGRVKIFGNRDYPTGFDTLTARIQLLGAANAVLHTADVTAVGADADVDHVVSPVVSAVTAVRVIVLTGESTGPGLAEIEAFAN